MKWLIPCIFLLSSTVWSPGVKAQSKAIIEAPPQKRLPLLWRYCTDNFVGDKDSVTTHRFLDSIISKADSLGDHQLKAYAQYFQKGWRIFFTSHFETHFPGERYQAAIDILTNTQSWAQKNNYADIAASCEHSIGQTYYEVNRYGLAFEHLFKADDAFKKIGYQHVPDAAFYLHSLGLYFYRFEEYDKALQKLLEATQYEFYIPRIEINTFNAIGLIYVRRNEPQKAISFFRNAINKAEQYKDTAWIGIASGNLGNVFLTAHRYDSALFYHRINYYINRDSPAKAPEDAAKTALSMATIFLRKGWLDSASFYVNSGNWLATHYLQDSTESLDFNRRLLQVKIDYWKVKGDFQTALLLTDSLLAVEKELTGRLDSKILSRAIEKTEAVSYESNLALLKSQKNLSQLRLYIIIGVLLMVLISIVFVFRDKWLRRKRQMQLAEKDTQILVAEKLRAEDGLKHAEELLKAYINTIKEKTLLVEHLESKLTDLKKATSNAPGLSDITLDREKLMRSTILTDGEWQQFRTLFEKVYPGFSYRLKETYPELSPAEFRFAYLTKLNLSTREMANMLGISVEAIHKLRYRLLKKLNLEETASFETVIQSIS